MRPTPPPTTGNAVSANAIRTPRLMVAGQKTATACDTVTEKNATAPPHPGCAHQGQCGGAAWWMLQASAAPLQREKQPQPNIASHRSTNRSPEIAPAAAKTAGFASRIFPVSSKALTVFLPRAAYPKMCLCEIFASVSCARAIFGLSVPSGRP